MLYAFRAAGFFALCMALAPAFSLVALAQEGNAESRLSEQTAQNTSETMTSSVAALPAPDESRNAVRTRTPADHAQNTGWVKVESGSRQAYVGIHGGTAPLSLMRSTDGALVAFTGQSGNDFAQVLKGGNASRAQAQSMGTDAASNETAIVKPAGQTPPAEAIPPVSERRTDEQAARQIENGERGPLDPAEGTASQPAPAQPASVPVADKTPLPALADAPGGVTMPATSENLIFASGGLASKDFSEKYQPFGLTPQAESLADTKDKRTAPNARAESKAKPLKLRSYQQILNYAGNV